MKSQIEERLLADDKFAREISSAEDELIEQYLDDELSPAERKHFINHFLAAPQRQQQLGLHQNLRKYAAVTQEQPALAPITEETPSPGWRSFFQIPAFSYAMIFLVMVGIGYGGVFLCGVPRGRNDVEIAMAELRQAYKGYWPLRSRIVGFEYAPVVETRGERDQKITLERERATGLLAKAVTDKRSAESLYGLGKAYLAKQDFPSATLDPEDAAALAPDNADLQSDLGALYLEAARNAPEKEKAGLVDKSLRSLQRAIELNPKLPDPRFNRALNLELQNLPGQAKQAWREYLELDPNLPWWKKPAGASLCSRKEPRPYGPPTRSLRIFFWPSTDLMKTGPGRS